MKRPVGIDRGQSLIPEPHRNLQAPLQLLSVPAGPLSCQSFVPVQGSWQPDDDAHGTPLTHLLGDLVVVLPALVIPPQGDHRVGQQTQGVGGRDAHPDLTDIDAEQHPRLLVGAAAGAPALVGHDRRESSTAARAAPVRLAS